MRAIPFVLFFLLYTPFVFAQEFNAGIVDGLWFAEEQVFAEDPTRVYVAIRNNTGSDLTGIVEFFDGEKKIGRKNVQALDGRIIESWTDWTPQYGEHTLKATLTRIELHQVGEETKEIEVVSALAQRTLFVDRDTDDDGIGNEEDGDDDGDGISDVQEKENGTDPLVENAQEEEDTSDKEKEGPEETGNNNAETTRSEAPQGLERYLADSTAEDLLSSATSFINDAKEKLDTYREKRSEQREPEVNEDGFGEVTRSSASSSPALKELSLTDFFVSVWHLFKTLIGWVFTLVLAVLSFALGHPTLIQVSVLLLVLFALLKVASRFGKRPKKL